MYVSSINDAQANLNFFEVEIQPAEICHSLAPLIQASWLVMCAFVSNAEANLTNYLHFNLYTPRISLIRRHVLYF